MNKYTVPEVGMIVYSRGHDKHSAQLGVVAEVLPNRKFKVDWYWLSGTPWYTTNRWMPTYDFKAFPSFTVRGWVDGMAERNLVAGLEKIAG